MAIVRLGHSIFVLMLNCDGDTIRWKGISNTKKFTYMQNEGDMRKNADRVMQIIKVKRKITRQ